MKFNDTNKLYLKGFNHGYMLANIMPNVLKRLLSLQHHPLYLEGLKKGQGEYAKDKEFVIAKNSKDRAETLKKIHANNSKREKDRDDLGQG